jgi:hypothetical protein
MDQALTQSSYDTILSSLGLSFDDACRLCPNSGVEKSVERDVSSYLVSN